MLFNIFLGGTASGKHSLLNCYSMLFLFVFVFLTEVASAQDEFIGLTSNGGPAGKGSVFTVKSTGSGFSILRSFPDWGKNPQSTFVQGDDGNFYGTTSGGGTFGYGSVFRMTPSGAVTILHQFDYANTGGYPHGQLTKGKDGNFYGVTSAGGANTYGTVFKVTPKGVLTVMKHFSYSSDGAKPRGHMVLASDGNFYGLTYNGGANGYGTVFKMSPAGSFSVLKSFNGTTDGGNCYGSLVQGRDGNFYGMTYLGGTNNNGTIFKITPTGTYTVLRHLKTATDGGSSYSTLIQAKDNYFYGMTSSGGVNGGGTVFRISSGGTFNVIRSLINRTDGSGPTGNLYENSDGNFYAMAGYGGANSAGTVFKITPSGTVTLLFSFTSATNGSLPKGSLVKGKDGSFYGMTSSDGTNLFGTAFKITSSGTFTLLCSFNGGSQGNAPLESLSLGKDNAFYGTTSSGGKYNNGAIFKICSGTYTILRSLTRNQDGGNPKGNIIQATDGNFYGTTSEGGANGGGTIFKITPSGTFVVVRHLTSSKDGGSPMGSLVQASDGYLYGMNYSGGLNGGGTIFKISTAGTFTVLRHLANATDGANPEGSLIIGKDKNFYGMTTNNGKIFKITPAGAFTILRSFVTTTDGGYPVGGLVLAPNGNFYGMTAQGGSGGKGTIFQMSSTGAFKVLKHFTLTTDGGAPKGNLIAGSDGSLYGLTSEGGTYKGGTMFKITTGGTYSVIRHWNLSTDGGTPLGSLLIRPRNTLVATPQSLTTAEEVAKSITLAGSGGSPLTFTVINSPKHGTISGTGASRVYTPYPNYYGTDAFTFVAAVGCMISAPATISLNITSVNDVPVLAVIGPKTVVKGTKLTFIATANDPDPGQPLSFSLVNPPTGATISATTGVFSWTPTTAGNYTIQVKVSDTGGSPILADTESIMITVTN